MKRSSTALIFGLVLTFLLFNFLTGLIATHTIPYLGHFSYPDFLEKADLPLFIERFASFDGIHYLRISQMGYHQNSTAFFPFYPLLIAVLNKTTLINSILIGQAVSTAALLGILILLQRYLKRIGWQTKSITWTLIFLLAFPTSFFLQSVYTESVFIFLSLTSLYFSLQKKYLLASIFGYLTGLTRIIGLFLFIPLVFQYLSQQKAIDLQKIRNSLFRLVKKPIILVSITAPVMGFATYSFYLYHITGDLFAFFTAQNTFSAGRSTQLILFPQVMYRYLKIFLTADMSFTYYVAVLEFSSFIFAGIILLLDLWNIWKMKYQNNLIRFGLNLFAVVMLLLPTFTGTFLSMPRFILPMLSIFLYLGQRESNIFRYTTLGAFIMLHTILLMYFIQGYFVS